MGSGNRTNEHESLATDETSEGELIVCPSCLHNNAQSRGLCEKCGIPIGKYTPFLLFEQTLATGACYRNATSNPRKLIVVIGMWILFLPAVFSALYFLSIASAHLFRSEVFSAEDTSFVIWPFLYGSLSTVILYRTTRNYVKAKK